MGTLVSHTNANMSTKVMTGEVTMQLATSNQSRSTLKQVVAIRLQLSQKEGITIEKKFAHAAHNQS